MYYFWDGKRQVYQVGLRSRNDIDVSAVAKKFGGGGHKQASGFTCDKIIWEKA
jgi:phosphoesterase RecJ-like protein